MTTLNDAILTATGGPTINDGLSTHFGRTADEALNDAEYRFLIDAGATPTQLNDMWFELLRALGYVGALNDMKLEFWKLGGLAEGPELILNWNFLTDGTGWFLGGTGTGVWQAPSDVLVTADATSFSQWRSDPFTLEPGNYRGRVTTGNIADAPAPAVPFARIAGDGQTDTDIIEDSTQVIDVVVGLTDVASFVSWRFDSSSGHEIGANLNALSFSLRRLP